MGYSIYYYKNGTTYQIYEAGDPDLVIAYGKYHREKRSVGTLTFKVLDNHPYFDYFEKFRGIIYLNFNNTRLFSARIFDVKTDIYNVKTVECEGLIAYLNDSVIQPYVFNSRNRIFPNHTGSYGMTVRDFINDLLDAHNAQVNQNQRVFLEDNASSEILATTISTQNSGYSTAWNELTDKVLQNYGGDIDLNLSQSDTTLKFIDGSETNVAQEIRYGINLKTLDRYYEEEFATAVYPISTFTDDDGHSQTINVTSVNQSRYTVVESVSAAYYGRINKLLEIKGATTPTDLMNIAVKRLLEMSTPRIKTKLTALDMYAIDDSYVPLKTGQFIRVLSEPNGVDATAEVTGFDADLLDPNNSTYILSGEFPTVSKLLFRKSARR